MTTDEQRPPLAALIPVPATTWRENELGRVVLDRIAPQTSGIRGWGKRLTHWLSPPRLRLDELGSRTWRRLDGQHSVADIARELAAELDDPVEEVEHRLCLFLSQLHRLQLIELGQHPPSGQAFTTDQGSA